MMLLLTSRGLPTPALELHFQEMFQHVQRLIIITTASAEYKEQNKHTIRLTDKLKAWNYSFRYLDVEFEDLDPLEQADGIIIAGGNPYYLLHHLRESRADIILRNKILTDVPCLAISAGAFVLAPHVEVLNSITPEMNVVQMDDYSALHIFPKIVIPHYDRFVNEGIIKEEILKKYFKESTFPLLPLREQEGLCYDGQEWKSIYQTI